MLQSVLKFVVCLITFTFSACYQGPQVSRNNGVVPEVEKPNHHFDTNRAKWLSSNVKNYSMNINANGFLRPFSPAVIEVHDSKFASVRPDEQKKDKHWANIYAELKLTTIDEIFSFIESESKRKPDVLDIIYDDRYGFPVSIILDRKKDWVDDELSVSVTNFQAK
jgi:hypothetical protein